MSGISLKSNWKFIGIIVLCIGILYGRSLQFDFVSYDDYELISQNGDFLSHVSNIVTSFQTHAFTTHRTESGYYRPLLLTSYILDYQLWTLNPLGYHLTNILLHCCCTVVLFFLLQLLIDDPLLSLFGSLLFALHPIQTEAVAWIAGRNDVLLGLFILLMIMMHVLSYRHEEKRNVFFFLAIVSFTFALLTKESGAFYFLLLPLYDRCIRKIALRDLFSFQQLRHYAPFLIVLMCYLAVRLTLFGEVIGAERLYGTTPLGERIMNIPSMISEHCKLIVAPFALSVVHPVDKLLWSSSPWPIVAVFISIALPVLSIMLWKKDPVACFGLLWFCVGLIPALGLFPVAVPILEHRLYVPLIGVIMIGVQGARLMMNALHRHSIVFGSIVVLLITASSLSFARLPVWRDSETMWSDAIAKAPTVAKSYFNLAGYYFERRDYDKTIGLMKQYIALKPDDFIGYSKLRETYFLAGDYTGAANVSREMIARNPANPNRYLEAGMMYEQLGRYDSAAVFYNDGLRIDSNALELHIHLAQSYRNLGRQDEALSHAQAARHIAPRDARVFFLLGMLASQRGDNDRAIEFIEQGMNYNQPPREVLQLLANLYQETGRADKLQQLSRQFHF